MDLVPVLNALYHAKRECEFEPGWIHADILADGLNEAVEFKAYDVRDVFAALNILEGQKLAEHDRGSPGFWRIARRFYNDLDEWCERVIEVLDLRPGWHDPFALRLTVVEIHHIELTPTMFAPIAQHLADKFAGTVEFQWGRVRIRTGAWLKRCQAQAL